MPSNRELAQTFEEIANLLDLAGEKFKPDAYRRAARSLESLAEDVGAVAKRNELRSIPGVGDAIEEKIREYLASGTIAYRDKLRKEFPPGLLELMRRPGIGPKTSRKFWLELGVEGPSDLEAAIRGGKLNGMKGFGERKIALLLAAVSAPAGATGERRSLLVAWETARDLIASIRAAVPVERIEAAGSLRRRKETIGDLDILVTSDAPEAVFDAFSRLPSIGEVKMRGPTKETVLLKDGFQVDLRVLEPAAYGAALQYFTGSKEHNVRVRSDARDHGLKVNEYGVFRGEERIAGRTEEEVYSALGLPWIPPEIRENQGELDRAIARDLPVLIERSALKGDLHVEATIDLGPGDLDEWGHAAERAGLGYLGFVVRGSGSNSRPEFTDPAVARRFTADPTTAATGVRFVRVTEESHPPERPTGPWLWRIDSTTAPPSNPPSVRPFALSALRLVSADGSAPPHSQEWLAWSAKHGIAVEITPFGGDDGVDAGSARRSPESLRFSVTSRARSPRELDRLEVALGVARRGWVEPGRVVNAGPFPLSAAESPAPPRPSGEGRPLRRRR